MATLKTWLAAKLIDKTVRKPFNAFGILENKDAYISGQVMAYDKVKSSWVIYYEETNTREEIKWDEMILQMVHNPVNLRDQDFLICLKSCLFEV